MDVAVTSALFLRNMVTQHVQKHVLTLGLHVLEICSCWSSSCKPATGGMVRLHNGRVQFMAPHPFSLHLELESLSRSLGVNHPQHMSELLPQMNEVTHAVVGSDSGCPAAGAVPR